MLFDHPKILFIRKGVYPFLMILFFQVHKPLVAQVENRDPLADFRSYSGENNNIFQPKYGAAHTPFLNFISNGYQLGTSNPSNDLRMNERLVSNIVGAQEKFMPNELGLSDFIWAWGQFIDHDINFNPDNHEEPMAIMIPKCDLAFDPQCTDNKQFNIFRSMTMNASGSSNDTKDTRRQHVNDISSFIDGSLVYGSDETRANWLRTFKDGLLKTSTDQLMPWNTLNGDFDGALDVDAPFMAIEGHATEKKCFVSGDIRANEQPALMALHVLFVREHNRLCKEILQSYPDWNDEQLFQAARRWVGAEIQAITYQHWLPAMGVELSSYKGYRFDVNPGILNVFSAAAFRIGHTMVNGRIIRLNQNNEDWEFNALDLRFGFFNPLMLTEEGGIDPILRGMAWQKHQMVDPLIMTDLRDFLFGPPGSGGLDLLAINLARGKERGLPHFNIIRENLGLSPHPTFESLCDDPLIKANLESVYDSLNHVDPWIGFMSEPHVKGSIMGESLQKVLSMQFENLRDGDRFYFEGDNFFTEDEINQIKSTTLKMIIERNTDIINLPDDVFRVPSNLPLAAEVNPLEEVYNLKIKAYPNPSHKTFNLTFNLHRPTQAVIEVFDFKGQVQQQKSFPLKRGEQIVDFNLKDELVKGQYILKITTATGKGSIRLIKS